MKPMLPKPTCLAGGFLAAALTALAAPLQRPDVPAEPTWVLHVDCDALRSTVVGQYLLTQFDKPDAQAGFAAFQTMFSFDPRKQLHGLTLYSTSNAAEDPVLLVYADFDADRLVTLAKAAKEAQNTPYKKHVIYSWTDEKKSATNGVKPRIYAAIQASRLVVFARREARVTQALDVLDQAAPNLSASTTFPQLGARGSSAIIEAAARKLNLPDSAPNAALFRLAKQMRLQAGEANRQVTATLVFETNGEDMARQAVTVAQAAVALAKLQKEKPAAGKLAEALSLKQDGPNLAATLTLPAADVINILKADWEKKAEKN